METTADRLRQARQQAGFNTAAEAIERYGWTKSTTYCHENGLRGLTRHAKKYARAYGISIDWLLTGKGGMKTLNEDYDALPPNIQKIAEEIIHGLRIAWERG